MSKTAPRERQNHPQSVTTMTVADFAAAARAKSTRKEYAKDVAYFVRDGGRLPATTDVVVEWLAIVAQRLAPATIRRRLISVHSWHKDNGHPSPVMDTNVKRVFAGICRTFGTAQRAVTPLVRDDLLSVIAAVERQKPVRAARDTALLLLMFSGALRRHSVVEICVEDIKAHEYGIDIHLRKSKTDQLGKGLIVSVPIALGDKCPVKAVAKWMEVSGIRSGPLFRGVNKHDQIGADKLDVGSVCRIVKHAVKLSGRDPSKYSSHSARAGFVTSAAAAQMPLAEIAQVTKHRGLQSLQKYLRVVEQRRIRSIL